MCAIAGAVGLRAEPGAEQADAILDAVARFPEQSRPMA